MKLGQQLRIKQSQSLIIHYGHLGDIINCLPFIKEVSKNKKCNLFIQLKKKIPEKFRLNDKKYLNGTLFK